VTNTHPPSNQELLRALEAVDRWKEKPELALSGYRRSMVVMAAEIERLVQTSDVKVFRDQQAEIERLRAALDTARAGVQAAYEAGVEDGKTGSIRPRGCGPVAADRDDNGAEK